MSLIDRAKVLAEIAELGSRVYGLLVDKSRAMYERDAKIKELEREIERLKSKLTGGS